MRNTRISEIFIKEAVKTESSNFIEILERLGDRRTMRLLHSAMGLSTESGEFLDALKKYVFYGKELDLVNLKEEIGDIFWYCAIACDELGISFEEIQIMVIAKLRKRYKDKEFASENAITRDLKIERESLEHCNLPVGECLEQIQTQREKEDCLDIVKDIMNPQPKP